MTTDSRMHIPQGPLPAGLHLVVHFSLANSVQFLLKTYRSTMRTAWVAQVFMQSHGTWRENNGRSCLFVHSTQDN